MLLFFISFGARNSYLEVVDHIHGTILEASCRNTYLGIANEKGETRKVVQNNTLFVGSSKIWGHAFRVYNSYIQIVIFFLKITNSNTKLIL